MPTVKSTGVPVFARGRAAARPARRCGRRVCRRDKRRGRARCRRSPRGCPASTRGDEDAFAGGEAERVGQFRRQILKLQAEQALGVRSVSARPASGAFGAGWFAATFLNCSTLSRTLSAGMAKPTPCVGTPCRSERHLRRADADEPRRKDRSTARRCCPGLIAASVWSRFLYSVSPIVMSRFIPLSTPRLMELL